MLFQICAEKNHFPVFLWYIFIIYIYYLPHNLEENTSYEY